MADRKVGWVLVPRVATEAMHKAAYAAADYETTEYDRTTMWDAMIAAATAASEGEDGAVAVARDLLELADILDMSGPKKHKDDRIDIMWDVMTAAARHLREHAATLTRPAAQAADDPSTPPKHDEGRETRDGITATDVGGGWLLKAPNGKEIFVAEETIAALYTQPAARRVTEQDVDVAFEAWIEAYEGDAREAMRAALESFAQAQSVPDEGNASVPAEGVSE